MKLTVILWVTFLLQASASSFAHRIIPLRGSQNRSVSGIITDIKGGILPGVTVSVKANSKIGTTTDLNGRYILNVPEGAVLIFSMLSYKKQEIAVGNKKTIDVTLLESDDALDEVVVTAFGNVQKKSDLIGAVTTISPKDLKVPSSNLTTALQGRIAGIVSFQRSGEPGMDNADFFIRGLGTFGVNQRPLILIDNMEVTIDQLARIPPDDIASFSILKDATASAVYGSRGANGVILVTTKIGVEGPAKISFRMEQRVSSATEKLKISDPVTFMKMNNEALLTRDPLAVTPYSDEKIAMTEAGADPILYPAVDWLSMITKDRTTTQNYSLSVTGGGSLATYAVSGSLTQDNGLLKVNPINNFNTNVDYKTYNLRSNINFNLTKSTQLMVRTIGNFQTYNGPPITGGQAFTQAISANPVLFQPVYQPGPQQSYIKHPLFGNYGNGDYANPYANVVRGYQQRNTNNMQIQLEAKQDLSSIITEGLKFRSLANITRTSEYQILRQYSPFYYTPAQIDSKTGAYTFTNINPNTGTETLDFSSTGRGLSALFYMENAFNYNRTFSDKHTVSGMAITTIRNNITQPNGEDFTLLNTLPFRNASFSGSFTYAYDNRYHFQFAFGYNGSERFDVKYRWGFFPSAGVAWTIHNEQFMQSLKDVVSTLRFRATYGLVGNDAISDERFFYLSDVNLNNSAKAYSFGMPGSLYTVNGVTTNRYANPTVRWEKSRQTNLGLDLGLFKNTFNLTVDAYRQDRSDIIQTRASLPAALGLAQVPLANLGKYRSEGVDAEATYNYTVNNDLWFQGRGTFTFARGEYVKFEEPYYNYSYLSRIGLPTSQQRGYIAERLFTDDNEVFNSPTQAFGSSVKGGDIKYLDVNGDGVINADDQVPIGYPTTPQINYGFGLSTGYKNFDVSFFFSGIGKTSLFINPSAIAPFGSVLAPKAVLKEIADSHWTEENQDIYAMWPRLSSTALANNTQTSTYWIRNGSFLRLKQVEVGYKLNPAFTRRIYIEGLRFYVSATNLFKVSSFDSWDPEMGGNGLAYPLQKVFNMGIFLTL
ncbi:TonB-dependent receptor [Pedobacter sp. PLR]|uniref:SusC/RagA family TonB-linked outer membrane protein n=1 Tax=Pedobacter sp. PLR TaxID=2994465 RepID=UPI002247894F|nr:TonB-dependent receptor [Pedobacter sp. PLR]MCX2452251.1 TonB-dependent receptor [Pedobacter sp. PLR]